MSKWIGAAAWSAKEARVGDRLPYARLVDEHTLMLRDGALLSLGDTHAAQGDGEVCGTAIESPMNTVVELDLIKGANLKMPRFETPGPVTRHLDEMGYEVTTGIGSDRGVEVGQLAMPCQLRSSATPWGQPFLLQEVGDGGHHQFMLPAVLVGLHEQRPVVAPAGRTGKSITS